MDATAKPFPGSFLRLSAADTVDSDSDLAGMDFHTADSDSDLVDMDSHTADSGYSLAGTDFHTVDSCYLDTFCFTNSF